MPTVEPTHGLATRVRHTALAPSSSRRSPANLYDAGLTERHRLGVLLQAAAVMAHLQNRGSRLDGCDDLLPFASAKVDHRFRLSGLSAQVGKQVTTTQSVLKRLALGLFDAREEIAGRGEARRSARHLVSSWSDDLIEQAPVLHVRRILRRAPFLWDSEYGVHREALVAEHVSPDGTEVPWVVGGAAFRERTLAITDDYRLLRLLAASDQASDLWRGREPRTESKIGLSPADLAERGHWGLALSRLRARPPETAIDRLVMAQCLFALGQFEEASESARRQRGRQWILLRARCAMQLGRLKAAVRELGQLDLASVPPESRLELIECALRVRANLGHWGEVRSWVSEAVRVRGPTAARARVLASEGSWDLNELGAMREHLEAAAEIDPEIVEGWRFQQALGLLAMTQGRKGAARAGMEAAMASGRRSMFPFQAGRMWNQVAIARALGDDLAGAERGFRHSVRLLSTCEGPSRRTLGLANLAEIRVRQGKFRGVAELLGTILRENELASNVRARAVDLALQARFDLAQGRLDLAEQGLRRSLDAIGDRDRGGTVRSEVEVLLARCLAWLGRRQAAQSLLTRDHEVDPEPGPSAAEPASERSAAPDGGEGIGSRIDRPHTLVAGVLEPEEVPALWSQVGRKDLARAGLGEECWASVWRSVLDGEPVTGQALRSARSGLGIYRGARLVLDLVIAGGSVQEEAIAMAASELDSCGASALGSLLAGRLEDSWQALQLYLAEAAFDRDALQKLFAASGLAGTRIEVQRGGEVEIVLPGPGGSSCTELEHQSMVWRFYVPSPSHRVEALSRVVVLTARLARRCGQNTGLPRGVVGQSAALIEAFNQIGRLAQTSMPVLILGESGTGKERAALSVHESSARAGAPFLPVNCAAVDQNLGLSDLFGHVKGAFTGADQDRQGVFEAARGGTVFLDEIGDLSAGAQGLLLRVLQEGEIRRLGESRSRPVDVRVVAATHRDLSNSVEVGEFRADLLYRLNAGTVELPPLRSRGDDVVLLADHFATAITGGKKRLSEGSRRRLSRQAWPGNIRQLRNFVERGCALAVGEVVEESLLPFDAQEPEPAEPWHEWLLEVKRARLERELELHDWNQSAAARSLGLTRQALSYLVRQLGLGRYRKAPRGESESSQL